MSEAEVLVAQDHGVVTVTLNRPDRLNSFNIAMHEKLRPALEAARDDPSCRCIVITGAGRGFCAGQDLNDRQIGADDAPPDLGYTLETYYGPLIRLIQSIEKPVIAAVNGVAAGAGANLALACDMVLATESAKFIQAFCKLGLVPDAGGTWALVHRVGLARAKGLALTGMPLSATQAEQWGLIWRAVPDAEFQAEVEAMAAGFAEAPTYGLGQAKMALQAAVNHDLAAQLDVERDSQRRCGRSPDFAEGVHAFLEKRPPVFTGKAAKLSS